MGVCKGDNHRAYTCYADKDLHYTGIQDSVRLNDPYAPCRRPYPRKQISLWDKNSLLGQEGSYVQETRERGYNSFQISGESLEGFHKKGGSNRRRCNRIKK